MKLYFWIGVVCWLILGLYQVQGATIQNPEEKEPWFPIWGVYCGLWHTNHYGKEPVDQMDRYCQFHDICVTIETQGYSSCWCNEQLYYLVSNVRPRNITESQIKDSILSYIYLAVEHCENHWGFDKHFKVTRVRPDVDERGFNYIVMYPHGVTDKFKVSLNETNCPANLSDSINTQSPSLLLKLSEDQFNQFVQDVHTDPVNNIGNYSSSVVTVLSTEEYIIDVKDEYYILYNTDQNNEATYRVINITECCTVQENNCTNTNSTNTYTQYEKVENRVIEIVLGVVSGVLFLVIIILTCILSTTCCYYRYRKQKPNSFLINEPFDGFS